MHQNLYNHIIYLIPCNTDQNKKSLQVAFKKNHYNAKIAYLYILRLFIEINSANHKLRNEEESIKKQIKNYLDSFQRNIIIYRKMFGKKIISYSSKDTPLTVPEKSSSVSTIYKYKKK